MAVAVVTAAAVAVATSTSTAHAATAPKPASPVRVPSTHDRGMVPLEGHAADADWGNTCTTQVTNESLGSTFMVESASKWPTDHWDGGDPTGRIWVNDGAYKGWKSGGGFGRGCSDTIAIHASDGATITLHTEDPASGSNVYTCSATMPQVPFPSPYTCKLGPDSTTKGPVLNVNWIVSQKGS